MEDKGCFDSLGELFWKICTGNLGEKWMDLDMHTMLLDTKLLKAMLNMCNPTLVETILKLREQFEKNDDNMKTAGEITVQYQKLRLIGIQS